MDIHVSFMVIHVSFMDIHGHSWTFAFQKIIMNSTRRYMKTTTDFSD